MPKRKRRKREGPPEIRWGAPAEQLPWFSDVDVVEVRPDQVILRRGPVTATVLRDGSFDVKFHSEVIVSQFMKIDSETSFEHQAKFSALGDEAYFEWLRHWTEPPPVVSFREGQLVSEWPGTGAAPPRRFAELGFDETSTWDRTYFKGSLFRFAHFRTMEGEEGAVILWYDPRSETFGGPWVYMGGFADFMAAQSLVDPGSSEEWRELNDEFGNAFMWALEKMGSFDRPGVLGGQALEAIREDPEALLDDSVEKMLPRLWEYPRELQEAALDWAFSKGLVKTVLEIIESAASARGKAAVAAGVRALARELGLEGALR